MRVHAHTHTHAELFLIQVELNLNGPFGVMSQDVFFIFFFKHV